jgi:hypothetical protein
VSSTSSAGAWPRIGLLGLAFIVHPEKPLDLRTPEAPDLPAGAELESVQPASLRKMANRPTFTVDQLGHVMH